MIVVPGSGSVPCDFMCIAEGPGATEAALGRPLCGPSGAALSWYLNRSGLSINQFYLDNVCREYREGNPDPLPEQLAHWTPILRATIAEVRPRVILTLGRYAARWFLGQSADMDSCHGIPHEGGEFVDDPVERAEYRDRACGAVIVPAFHPAYGLRQLDARTLIDQDIARAAEVIRLVRGGRRDLVPFRRDPYVGREIYEDCSGPDLRDIINRYRRMGITHCGYDTEGTPEQPFSLQWSPEPGTGYMLRVGALGFEVGIAAVQELVDSGVTIAVHDAGTPRGTGYDTQTSRTMGLMLGHGRLSNTMYSAFALRTEPKGLKPLLWRWCGMRQHDYWGMVEAIGREKQIRYLGQVAARRDEDATKRLLAAQRGMLGSLGSNGSGFADAISLSPAMTQVLQQFAGWPRVPSRVERQNDGTITVKNFGKLESRAKSILTDIASGKIDKDEKPTDPHARWRQLEPELRKIAEEELGAMPIGTMWDVPLADAVYYSCLHGPSLVETEEGPRKIEELVKARYSGRVWSVDGEGRRVLSRVIGWYRNTDTRKDSEEIQWWTVETESSKFGRWGQMAARYTPDHRLLTSRGWQRVDQITSDDWIATGIERLTKTQEQIVLGGILGDGSISRRNTTGWAQFRMSHNVTQLDYLKWKSTMLWGSPVIRLLRGARDTTIGNKTTRSKDSYECACESHPQLVHLKEEAYSGQPNEIVVGSWAEQLHAFGLAIWYQDDGTLVSGRYPRIYTLAMNEDSTNRLKGIFLSNFNIVASSYIEERGYTFGGHILTIRAEWCDDFFGLIAPFVHPSMRYKLPEKYRSTIFCEKPIHVPQGQFFARVRRVYRNPIPGVKRGGRKTSYCIDVEGTHNFVTSGGEVAHNCRDADGTGRLDTALNDECRRLGVDGVCWTGNEILPILEEMQHEGMPASRRAFVDLASQMQCEMDQIQSHIRHTYWGGKPFNPAPNTKDVAEMVVRLGITGLKKTPTGKSSTSMKSLEYLGSKYPAIKDVGEWRRRYKVLGTYCLPLIEIADEQLGLDISVRKLDGQINPDMHLVKIGPGWATDPESDAGDIFCASGSIKPVTVETRRLAMEDPSLLNQPVRTEIGRKVRACYMTTHDDDPDNPETEVFVAMDYSAQEVRITAHVTGDRLLCAIVTDPKRKIHMETASRVFGKPIADIDEISEKIPAKTAFFGMLYGMQGPGLLDLFRSFGLENWPLEECERLIGEIFKIYPALKVTIDRVAQETRRTGMVRDLYGHIRYLPGIWSARRGEAAEAARQAFSHVVQATAQGQMQNAMASMRRPVREMQLAGLHLKWTLQVHDEVILRTRRWLVGAVLSMMERAMVSGYGGPRGLRLSVPVLVDGHYSTQWAKLK